MVRDALEHTKGGSTTKDATDLGPAMREGTGPQGPEDAFAEDQASLRGDYAGRTGDGLSYTFERQEDGSVKRVQQSGKPEGS